MTEDNLFYPCENKKLDAYIQLFVFFSIRYLAKMIHKENSERHFHLFYKLCNYDFTIAENEKKGQYSLKFVLKKVYRRRKDSI